MTTTHKRFDAVIFDLFGTLIENFRIDELNSVLREMALALTIPPVVFRKQWTASFHARCLGEFSNIEANLEMISRELGRPIDPVAISEAARIRAAYSKTFLERLFPDSISTLSEIKARGYKLGLISDCSTEVPSLWAKSQIAEFFDVVIFSSVIKIKKPDRRIYELALKQLGTSSERTLYIGDGGSHELSGAAAVGMTPLLIQNRASRDGEYVVDVDSWVGPRIRSPIETLEYLK